MTTQTYPQAPRALAMIVGLLSALSVHAAILTTENFNSNWPGVPQGTWQHSTNSLTGWQAYTSRITGGWGTYSAPYAAALPDNDIGEAWVMSPALPNGLGSVSFWAKNIAAGYITVFQIEGSPDATNWTVHATITNSSTAFTNFSITINSLDANYFRIHKIFDNRSSGGILILDDIEVASVPSIVIVTNVYYLPPVPFDNDTVNVYAQIGTGGNVSNVALEVNWREGSNAWSTIGMASNLYGLYATTSAIPAQLPGATVQYYIHATWAAGAGTEQTNYPAAGSNGPLSYTVQSLLITNVFASPAAPSGVDNVYVTAQIATGATVSALSLSTWWRIAGGSWASLGMTATQSGTYVTTTPIPAQPAGTRVDYYVQAVFTDTRGPQATNYPVAGASAPLSYLVTPYSAYTGVVVQGAFTTNLNLVADGQWQGVVYLAAPLTNAAFNFVARNTGLTNTWGDLDPASTNYPFYGLTETGAPAIVLSGISQGYIVFNFNETNGAYSVLRCAHVSFDGWTGTAVTNYGTHTNSDGWVLGGGRVSGNSSEDLGRVYRGKSAFLTSTNAINYLRSPVLSNGIGQISFWYRNWETDGDPAVSFTIQIATSTTATVWHTLATVTNVTAPSYFYYTLTRSEREYRCVRIVNASNSPPAQLCLDEVIVAEPGAGVLVSNISLTPPAPTVLDTVHVEATITPVGGASNLTATVWYRQGTNTFFDWRVMTNDYGNHFVTVTPLPNAGTGTVYYFIACSYAGFQAEQSSPQVYPPDPITAPLSYSVVFYGAYRSEDYTTNYPLPQTTFQDSTNAVTGWIARNARVTGGFQYSSPPYACVLNDSASGETWIQSPLLSNGVGSVYFKVMNRFGIFGANYFNVEYSYDGTTWYTNETFVNVNNATFTEYRSVINSLSNMYVRLRKIYDTGFDLFLVVDDIAVSYPPAMVNISDVWINPGYPMTTDYVTVSCTITSVNPYFPAIGITPVIYHRASTSSNFTGMALMARTGEHEYSTTFGIPPYPRDTIVQYYVDCRFSGYYYRSEENQSPTYYPLAGPTGPTSYTVRAFSSDYGSVNASINGTETESRLLDNHLWQGVLMLPQTTNQLQILFRGHDLFTGSGYSTNVTVWGNTNNWKNTLPIVDVARTGESAIVASGSYDGQIVVRFNDLTGEYSIQRCVWQDFNEWSPTAQKYMFSYNDNSPPLINSFENWSLSQTRFRVENFDVTSNWWYMTSYTNNAAGGTNFFYITYSRILWYTPDSKYSVLMTNQWFFGHVAQKSWEGFFPLRGIGTVSFSYRPYTTNAVGLAVYLTDTNDAAINGFRVSGNKIWSTNNVTNALSWASKTITVNTYSNQAVVFAHEEGAEHLLLDSLYVDEWYGDTRSQEGWIVHQGWITRAGNPMSRCCVLDRTRTHPSLEQYIRTPQLTNGASFIDFSYAGGNSNPVSFAVEMAYAYASNTWYTLTAATNNSSVWSNFSYAVLISSNIYLRIRNTTPAPGILMVDNVRVNTGAPVNNWEVNNGQIEAAPATRPWEGQPCYLNSNRTANIDTNNILTNIYPYVRTPYMPRGIGEISFWYRNWHLSTGNATNNPGRLVIQSSGVGGTNDAAWKTLAVIPNIVNVDDYHYYRTSVYDTTSRYVRIYNDDVSQPNLGRVCLDDILVTDPLAVDIHMSNLVLNPQIPLHTNTVDVYVDLYDHFLFPSNVTAYLWYSTATNYGGWTSYNLIPMSPIASNVNGRWFRYKTDWPIPTNAIDTFVRYFVRLTFDGFHAEGTQPKTNQQFTVVPTWYDPMNAVYGTNQTYYIVFSCPPKAVWINEFNSHDYDPPQPNYVELCGPAGTDIRNWLVEIFDDANPPRTVAVYRVTSNYILPNDTNGFGFWVVGDANVSTRDLLLTNQIPQSGGIRLRRSMGATEQAICFSYNQYLLTGLLNAGFTNIGTFDDYIWGNEAVGLVGTGSAYTAFTWGNPWTQTPGAVNEGQMLVAQNAPPEVVILEWRVGTNNIWIVCTGAEDWVPIPTYATNLPTATQPWPTVPGFSSTYPVLSSGTYTVWFPRLTNSPVYYYQIRATNGP